MVRGRSARFSSSNLNPQGDFHDLTFNDSNPTSFNCNDGAPCDASTSLRYLDSNITAGFGTGGTVEADFTITSTAVPEPGTFGLLVISLLALMVLSSAQINHMQTTFRNSLTSVAGLEAGLSPKIEALSFHL